MAVMECPFFFSSKFGTHHNLPSGTTLGGLGRQLQPVCCILFSAKMCDAGMKVQGVYSVVHCRDSVGDG